MGDQRDTSVLSLATLLFTKVYLFERVWLREAEKRERQKWSKKKKEKKFQHVVSFLNVHNMAKLKAVANNSMQVSHVSRRKPGSGISFYCRKYQSEAGLKVYGPRKSTQAVYQGMQASQLAA